ncbi:MAG: DegQ family serine endoprotease [Calditrichaeota bacterium]|nr:DegQ family serine endoprotease [Calditrichota bacterium]RQW04700.1 MAG: DegQ family serine endoprotease [Calditrichota bacterium]
MSSKSVGQRIWIFVLSGIIIGLMIGAGLEWTSQSPANQSAPAQQEQAQKTSQVNPEDIAVAEQLSNVFASVADKTNPSVVTIFTETTVSLRQRLPISPFEEFFGEEFFKRFFQQPEGNREYTQRGLGSGVIMRKDGILVTNNHVIRGVDKINVSLLDGREFEARVEGTDSLTDLAVLTIDANDLQPIKLGDSDRSRVGEWVLAIGSPLNPQLQHTVTAGIISARGRSGVGLTTYEDYIQTDAAINPGNSGGALVNLRGELIGINAAIATRTGGNMGIGFAIPVNLVQKVMTDILEKGRVVRGWLGVTIQDIDPEIGKALGLKTTKGVLITQVQEGTPAEKAGLKTEDVIIKVNGDAVNNTTELATRIASTSPGKEVTLTVIRDGKERKITATLGELESGNLPLAQRRSESTYEKVGLQLSNITPGVAQKYNLKEDQRGVVVTAVDPGSLASQAGFRPGDVILKLNRKDVKSVEEFDDMMDDVKEGGNLLFYIQRGEGNLFIAFTKPGK